MASPADQEGEDPNPQERGLTQSCAAARQGRPNKRLVSSGQNNGEQHGKTMRTLQALG
jgi:hypothetical protein